METVFNEEKDVEGLSHTWIQRMYHNVRWLDAAKTKKAILPCTPLAVIKVLKYRTLPNLGPGTPRRVQHDLTIWQSSLRTHHNCCKPQ
jgi:hypothetical protein